VETAGSTAGICNKGELTYSAREKSGYQRFLFKSSLSMIGWKFESGKTLNRGHREKTANQKRKGSGEKTPVQRGAQYKTKGETMMLPILFFVCQQPIGWKVWLGLYFIISGLSPGLVLLIARICGAWQSFKEENQP
jgi:hypothetical protein